MTSVALRLFIFCLFPLYIQGNEETVNTAILAKMIQYFDLNLQPTWNDKPNQYSVLIRLPSEQCTTQFSLDLIFNVNEVTNTFNDFKTKSKRFFEVTNDSVSLTAAKPSWESEGAEENDHSEYILLSPKDAENSLSPLQNLSNPNNDQCVVLYTYYSPCIEKCITDENKNILKGLSDWNKTAGIKAFVFQEIWPSDLWNKVKKIPVLPMKREEEFAKINALVPLYRCVDDNDQMQCYKCTDNDNESLLQKCVV